MSTTPTPTPKPNFLETLLLGLLSVGESIGPIFIHSKNAMAVLNVTEPIFNQVIGTVVAQQQEAAAAAAPITAAQTTSSTAS